MWNRVLVMIVLSVSLAGVESPPAPQHAVPKPAWASATGDDPHGHWADLTVHGVTQRFRWIPPGTFTMGSPQTEKDATAKDDLDPRFIANEVQHQVTLSQGFWLADSSCTQALWKSLMGINPATFLDHQDCPVDTVSWTDIQEFLPLLNASIAGGCFTLPTEAQREYACRAGTEGEFAGPSLDVLGWFFDNSEGQTHPVKSKTPNAWGLYDMHGNVWEMCSDWYADYPPGPAIDPMGPPTGTERVRRGGCWSIESSFCRSAYRVGCSPNERSMFLGFRICAPAVVP
jgi:formylglycine-generating enzyme required for sulfatase activity